MPNPLLKFKEHPLVARARHVARILWHMTVGLAHDFWKDGKGSPAAILADGGTPGVKQKGSSPLSAFVKSGAPKADPRQPKIGPDGLWHALPGEISEKMWGQDYVTPGDEYITDRLIRPLGINKDTTLLDLSAGLGGRLRKTAEEYGVYINGLEPDLAIAARGMEMSVASGMGKHAAITAYDPMKLAVEHSYDCIIARETIYRVPDKDKFVMAIIACCKPQAQVSFTDYIVNPEVRAAPAIAAWRAFEAGADPLGLVEMAELWAKGGVNLRVHDDQTEYYKKEVKTGLARFAKFMASGIKPDAETKKAIDKRITTWAHRMAAIEAGMKFYRFYGLK